MSLLDDIVSCRFFSLAGPVSSSPWAGQGEGGDSGILIGDCSREGDFLGEGTAVLSGRSALFWLCSVVESTRMGSLSTAGYAADGDFAMSIVDWSEKDASLKRGALEPVWSIVLLCSVAESMKIASLSTTEYAANWDDVMSIVDWSEKDASLREGASESAWISIVLL